jgi:PAS domain S-box-containing protein
LAERSPLKKESRDNLGKKKAQPDPNSIIPTDKVSQKNLEGFFSSPEERIQSMTLLDAVSDGVWEWNIQTDQIWFSEHWRKMTGYSQEDTPATFSAWLPLINEEDQPDLKQAIADHFSGKNLSINVDYRLRVKDGGQIWLRDQGKIVDFDENGKPTWAIGTHTNITELKNALSQINNNEQTIRTLLNAAPDNAALINMDGVVLMVNKQMADFFKTEVDVIIGDTVENYLHGEPRDLFLYHLDAIKRTGLPQRYERILNGQVGVVMMTPIYNIEGELTSAAVYVRDLTDQKSTETALIAQERLYRSLLEYAFDGIMVIDTDNRIRYTSPGTQHLLGYSQTDLLGKNMLDYVAPDHHETFLTTIAYLKANPGRPFLEENLLKRKKGSLCMVEAINVNLLDDPYVRGIVINFRDITGRKEAEVALRGYSERLEEMVEERTQALQVSEARFRAVFESSLDPILVWDKQYRCLFANQAATNYLGTSQEMIIGKTIQDADAHIPDFMEFWISRIEMAFESENAAYFEDEIQMAGKKVYSESNIFPIHSPQGEIFAIGLVYRDITQRKKAELALERNQQELEAVNKELKDFAYVVSHDLKAPLRAIGQLAAWVRSDYKELIAVEGQEMLELIVKRTNRMQALIEGVLTYSRLGREKEDKIEIDLNILMAEIIENISPPPNIVVEVQEGLPTIIEEPTRVQQVFQNLISNAIKFIDKPAGEVKISALEHSKEWEFVVADNGPGIPERFHEKIFQMFQTLQPRDQYESTGIGLTLVKKAVEAWGGKVWVISSAGKGAEFHFTFPIGGIDEGN